MPLQTGSADLSHFDEDEPTVEKATLDAHITEVIILATDRNNKKTVRTS